MKLLRQLPMLGVLAFFSAGVAQGEDAAKKVQYPRIEDLVSKDGGKQDKAVSDFIRARRKSIAELAKIVHVDSGKQYDNSTRARACFLVAHMRASSPVAIRALVSSIDRSFVSAMLDRPYGVLSPPDALICIGKPALPELLKVVAKDRKAIRRMRAIICIMGIEGEKFGKLLLAEAIEKTKGKAEKRRLQQTLKTYEDLRKKAEEEEKAADSADSKSKNKK